MGKQTRTDEEATDREGERKRVDKIRPWTERGETSLISETVFGSPGTQTGWTDKGRGGGKMQMVVDGSSAKFAHLQIDDPRTPNMIDRI